MLSYYRKFKRGFYLGYPQEWKILVYNILAWLLGGLLIQFRLLGKFRYAAIHRTLGFYLIIMGVYFAIRAWSTPPGLVDGRQYNKEEGQSQCDLRNKNLNGKRIQTYRYCKTCKIIRPPLASHCKYCQFCVHEFDHHCPFVANCVGRDNLKWFVGMVIVYSVGSAYACILSLQVILNSLKQNQVGISSILAASTAFENICLVFYVIAVCCAKVDFKISIGLFFSWSLAFGPLARSGVSSILIEQWQSSFSIVLISANISIILYNGGDSVVSWWKGQTAKQRAK